MRSLSVVVLLLVSAFSASAQIPPSPFGVDVELFPDYACNPSIGCPTIDLAQQAGAHLIRLLAVWHDMEPQQGVFNWSYLPWQIWYAQQHGLEIVFTAVWAPQWANGATSSCPPFAGANQHDAGTSGGTGGAAACQNGYTDVGSKVLNSSYTYSFFYNLALQFNGSNTSGCATNDVATCHPLVRYFGVWNEPNGRENFWDPIPPTGQNYSYLADFVTLYLWPAYNGVKAANPSAYVMAPDISTGTGYCGANQQCDWATAWIQPLGQYFSGSFDMVSIHGYQTHNTDKVNAATASAYTGKRVWMTEQRSNGEGPNGLTWTYIDRYNRSSYWDTIFYSWGGLGANCSTTASLTCGSNGSLVGTGYFSAYQSVYGPH